MAPAAAAAAAWGSTRPLLMRLSASGSDCGVLQGTHRARQSKGWRGPLVKDPPLCPHTTSSGSLLLSAHARGRGRSPCGASPNHSALRPPMCGLVDELCCQHAARLNCQAGFPLAAPLSFQ
jgi:hypothetical protein